jgi:transposase
MRHYDVSNSTIRRWLSETGLSPAPRPKQESPKRRPIPDDWAQVTPTLAARALADHYSVSLSLINRWAKESGVRPKRAPKGRLPGSIIASVPQVDASLAARAAQHLRRRHIVYHCAVLPAHERRGLPNKGRDHWYVNGRGALPAADMIALAEQTGFQA